MLHTLRISFPVPSETHDMQHLYLMTQELTHDLFRADYKYDLHE